jgi:hypothetical protein
MLSNFLPSQSLASREGFHVVVTVNQDRCSTGGECVSVLEEEAHQFEEDVKALIYMTYLRGFDRLCGLVVTVLGYRSGGPSSIPGTTRKKSSGSGTECTQPREYN